MGSEAGNISLGKTLSFSMEILIRNFGLLLTLTLIPLLPTFISQMIYAPKLSLMVRTGQGLPMGHAPSLSIGMVLLAVLWVVFAMVTYMWSAASTALIVQQSVLDRAVSPKDILKAAIPCILPGVGTGLLCAVILFGWSLLLVIPGIIFALYYIFIVEAVALRGVGFMDALRYSRNLVKGHWWMLGWVFFVCSVLAAITIGVPYALAVFLLGYGVIALSVYSVLYVFVTSYLNVVRVVLFLALECMKGQGVIIAATRPATEPVPAAVQDAVPVPEGEGA